MLTYTVHLTIFLCGGGPSNHIPGEGGGGGEGDQNSKHESWGFNVGYLYAGHIKPNIPLSLRFVCKIITIFSGKQGSSTVVL
jgi:hypothetical protein